MKKNAKMRTLDEQVRRMAAEFNSMEGTTGNRIVTSSVSDDLEYDYRFGFVTERELTGMQVDTMKSILLSQGFVAADTQFTFGGHVLWIYAVHVGVDTADDARLAKSA